MLVRDSTGLSPSATLQGGLSVEKIEKLVRNGVLSQPEAVNVLITNHGFTPDKARAQVRAWLQPEPVAD